MNNAFFIAQMLRTKSADSVGRDVPTRSAPVHN
jgi:hypothetical protein